jgi:hypothetical protein
MHLYSRFALNTNKTLGLKVRDTFKQVTAFHKMGVLFAYINMKITQTRVHVYNTNLHQQDTNYVRISTLISLCPHIKPTSIPSNKNKDNINTV